MTVAMQDGIPDQEGGEALLTVSNGNSLNDEVAFQSSTEAQCLVGGDELRHPWRFRLLAVFTAVGLLSLVFSFGLSFGSARVQKAGWGQMSSFWSAGNNEFTVEKAPKAERRAKLPAPPLSAWQLGVVGADNRGLEDAGDVTQENIPMCVVNTIAAFFYLNQAGVEVAGAADACPDEKIRDRDGKIGCASSIFGVLQSFISTGSLIAGLLTQCDNQTNLPADCAANVMGLVGTIFQALEAGLSSHSTCKEVQAVKARNRLLLGNKGAGGLSHWNQSQSKLATPRRTEGIDGEAGPVTGLKAGWCWVNVGSSGAYLASIGVNIEEAVRDGSCGKPGAKNQSACAANIASVFAAVANSVAYLAGAASQCSETAVPGADCVNDWGAVVNTLASVANAGAQFLTTCEEIGQKNNTNNTNDFTFFTPV
eukprot:TRINITY_DN9707_c0_g2_i1.p1 TRINITY_DN9707_c0_g2~~TRINITY_DN9707_c0_g2_i1.p1  ORF type:complete len:423 (+),score=83.97 TRINITY_DN9707_c0_g2_i1:64-1332(+)